MTLLHNLSVFCSQEGPISSCSPATLPFSAVISVPGLVHNNVYPGALQQLLLCCPPAGYRHGVQDLANHLVFGHSQRQTGECHAQGLGQGQGKASALCWSMQRGDLRAIPAPVCSFLTVKGTRGSLFNTEATAWAGIFLTEWNCNLLSSPVSLHSLCWPWGSWQ